MDSQQRPPRRTARGSTPRSRTIGGRSSRFAYEEGPRIVPVLPIRNAVVLPYTVTPLYIDDEKTRRAIEAALLHDGYIFAVAQREERAVHPAPHELFVMGVEAIVEKSFITPEGGLSVMLRALRRGRSLRYIEHAAYLRAEMESIPEIIVEETPELIARMRMVREHFEAVCKANGRIVEDAVANILNISDPGSLADAIAMALELTLSARQAVLEALNPIERLVVVDELLVREMAVQEVEAGLQQKVQQEMDRGQKEYYLREQIKIFQRELAENDPTARENMDLRERVAAVGMPEEVLARANREIERLEAMPSMAPEYTVLRTYIDWLLTLPWQTTTTDRLDLAEAEAMLNANHFGLENAKERLIEFLAVRKQAPTSRSPILCFAGPPGVGKTSLGRSIADALGRKFVRISLGGVRDEAEIRGHRRTYVGALPGRIIQTMRIAGTLNPLFVLDEIDKLASDYRGDPASALLEVLDPEQNHAFSDHYLEVPYDLSKVIFILTANSLQTIPPALLDRMEVIELPGYTQEEKVQIAEHFLIPRQIKDHGLTPAKVEMRTDALRRIIQEYTYEAGVRNLEREIGSIMRKITRRVVEGKKNKVIIHAAKVPEFLGPQKSFANEAETHDQVGVAMGVAWTAAGGDLTPIEIAVLEGRGNVLMTGQLGDMLRESVQAAISYARSRAHDMHLPEGFHEKSDIHVHLPMAGVRKDGPSAGVPIAMALISALSGRPVRHDIAMTGEITLRGRVMPVGGLKEKAYAAYRAGLKQFILPRKNLAELDVLPDEIKAALRLVPVDTLDDVLPLVLCPSAKPLASDVRPDILNPVSVLVPNERDGLADEAARPADKPNPVTPLQPHDPPLPARHVIVGVN
jgi:ATP-dependent Lon protease